MCSIVAFAVVAVGAVGAVAVAVVAAVAGAVVGVRAAVAVCRRRTNMQRRCRAVSATAMTRRL